VGFITKLKKKKNKQIIINTIDMRRAETRDETNGERPETRRWGDEERREARGERREARGERREARGERWEARGERREARDEIIETRDNEDNAYSFLFPLGIHSQFFGFVLQFHDQLAFEPALSIHVLVLPFVSAHLPSCSVHLPFVFVLLPFVLVLLPFESVLLPSI
jgi:hypothetical protein